MPESLPEPTPAATAVWDRLAASYRWQEPLEAASLRTLVRLALPRPQDVTVDLGCGPGTLTGRLAALPPSRRPRRLLALDSSPAMLALLRRRDVLRPGWAAVRSDSGALPLRDASVDLVLCGWLLHVLGDDERRRTLGEVSRVLTPGGRVALAVPGRPHTAPGRALRSFLATAATKQGSRALRQLPDLAHELASAGLVQRVESHTGRGYASRVLLASGDVTTGRAGSLLSITRSARDAGSQAAR